MMKIEPEILASIITSGVSLVVAAVAALTAYFRARKAKHEKDELAYQNDAIDEKLEALEKSRSYVICPDCGSEIPAADLEVMYHTASDEESILRLLKDIKKEVK